MKIVAVELTNFMNISHASVPFSDGLNILYGENAQGKSAILAAIYYVLTDNKRGDSWKDFVKTGEDQFTIVLTLQKSIHDPTPIICTYTGHKAKGVTTKTIIEGSKPPVTGADECKALLQSWFDLHMIEAVIFSLQDSKPIGALSPSERAAIFKKLFNSDFSTIVDQILTAQKGFEDTIKTAQAENSTLQQQTYPLSRLAAINEEEYAQYKHRAAEIQNQLSRYHDLSGALERLTAAVKLLESQQQTVDSLQAITADRLQRALADYTALQTKIDEAQSARSGQEAIEKALQTKLAAIIPPVEPIADPTIQSAVTTLQLQLRAYESGTCPTCGQVCDTTHAQDLQASLQELQSQQDQYTALLAQYKKDKQKYDTDVRQIQVDIGTTQQQIRKYDDTIRTLQQQLQADSPEAITARITQQGDIETQKLIAAIQQQRDWIATQPAIDTISTQLQAIPYTDLSTDSQQLQQRIQTIDALRIKNNQIAIENQKWLDKKVADEARITKNDETIHELQTKLATLAVVKKIYQTEFPAYINTKACSKLETFMNMFLAATSNNMVVSLQQTKKGTEFYYKPSDSADWINAKMASGFESSALTIAFNAAVALAYKSSILVLDEVDKSASDISSLKVANTISSISGFNQLFMITHKKDTVDALKDTPSTTIYHVQKGTFKPFTD